MVLDDGRCIDVAAAGPDLNRYSGMFNVYFDVASTLIPPCSGPDTRYTVFLE